MSSPGVYADTGLFVCFEGGEGAGKSTQARLLRELLEAGARRACSPSSPATPRSGRRAAPDRARPGHRRAWPTARRRCCTPPTRPSTSTPSCARRSPRGEVVITDRYVDSTLAYQGAGRDARRSRGRGGRPVGDRRPAPAPDGAARPRAAARAGPVRRAATGSRASRWSSTSGCARRSWSWPRADPDALPGPRRPGPGGRRSPRRCGPGSAAAGGGRGARERLGRPGRPAPGDRALREAARPAAGRGMTPRVAVHRAARVGPLQRRAGVRGGAAVRAERRCGACHACHTVLVGSHADVTVHPHREALASASTRCASWSAARRWPRSGGAGR